MVGCVNMSTLQTAQTLEPGRQRFLVGGGYYESASVNQAASSANASDTRLALPYTEIGYRRGIVENLELGAKVTIPGTTGIDGKYRFIHAGKFAVAAGLGVSYLKIDTGSGMGQASTQLIDAMVPLYVSYDIARPLALYLSPKYVARFASSTDTNMMVTSGMQNLVGGTVGVRVGTWIGVFLEASYLRDVSSTFDTVQVNGSMYF
jgi:hypothetical protein